MDSVQNRHYSGLWRADGLIDASVRPSIHPSDVSQSVPRRLASRPAVARDSSLRWTCGGLTAPTVAGLTGRQCRRRTPDSRRSARRACSKLDFWTHCTRDEQWVVCKKNAGLCLSRQICWSSSSSRMHAIAAMESLDRRRLARAGPGWILRKTSQSLRGSGIVCIQSKASRPALEFSSFPCRWTGGGVQAGGVT